MSYNAVNQGGGDVPSAQQLSQDAREKHIVQKRDAAFKDPEAYGKAVAPPTHLGFERTG
jgi:hypothetical protein